MNRLHERELELVRLTGALEELRIYFAGPCVPGERCGGEIATAASCKQPYDGHRHWTRYYEVHRSFVVALNAVLAGDYHYASILREIGQR